MGKYSFSHNSLVEEVSQAFSVRDLQQKWRSYQRKLSVCIEAEMAKNRI